MFHDSVIHKMAHNTQSNVARSCSFTFAHMSNVLEFSFIGSYLSFEFMFFFSITRNSIVHRNESKMVHSSEKCRRFFSQFMFAFLRLVDRIKTPYSDRVNV